VKAETLPIAELTPDAANARLHDRRNVAAIKASLERFGQTRPLVVTEDLTVIAGNGTLAAMAELGWKEAVVTRVPFATAEEARAFALADNKTAELAQWNAPVLLEALESLALEGWPIEELGFEPQDLAALGRRFEKVAPEFFPAFDDDIETLYCCPRCAYEWSGRQA
jgi:ParB-like chromosome segregation protein Spo0J